ncbi:hypothetical protein AX774_g2658 [Zancudomyces culisetae]|uniref:Uncharacterized protein n=1 Tax=Zancudomyces culisetae TaxID=1213189 RepID=A0A1R1PS82_ZANCU|nr:hypothetical protein AX774_g2658 [Zancudomyces culisetae]|eukprot:OMH83827.1 hypothetical protein AX774_g2658 [Zancudomyces culisetae]
MEQITEINNTTNVEQEAQNEVMNGHNEVVMVESGEKTEFGEEEQEQEGEEERIKREQASQRRKKVDFSSKEEFPELGKPKAEKTIAPTTWAFATDNVGGADSKRGPQIYSGHKGTDTDGYSDTDRYKDYVAITYRGGEGGST